MTLTHPKKPCPRLLSYKALASSLLPKNSQSSPHSPNRLKPSNREQVLRAFFCERSFVWLEELVGKKFIEHLEFGSTLFDVDSLVRSVQENAWGDGEYKGPVSSSFCWDFVWLVQSLGTNEQRFRSYVYWVSISLYIIILYLFLILWATLCHFAWSSLSLIKFSYSSKKRENTHQEQRSS